MTSSRQGSEYDKGYPGYYNKLPILDILVGGIPLCFYYF